MMRAVGHSLRLCRISAWCLCCAVSSSVWADASVAVTGVVRLLPTVAAAYVRIVNRTDAPVVFVSAAADGFARAAFHRTVIDNGIAKMVPEKVLTITPRSTLVMEQGGLHIMLLHRQRVFAVGDSVVLRMTSADGVVYSGTLPVVHFVTPTKEKE